MSNNNLNKMKNAKPIDDLELFELICAAYPERFDENADGCIWDEVMGFAEDEFSSIDGLSDLLGRVTLLTNPMSSAISGTVVHCIGQVDTIDGQVGMTACVSRSITQN